MYKATHPLEYICFFPAEFPTRDDGDVFAFIFVDVYSKFVIITGMEKNRDAENVLKHIKSFTRHEDFLKHKDVPFTLITHKYQEIAEDILKIIEPLNGKMIIDDPFVAKEVTPVVESLYESMASKDFKKTFMN